MARTTKRTWLEEGLKILAEVDARELTIDVLTTRLGVTKGSFYHHFKNYQDFKESLLTFFEQEGTLQIIKLAEEAESPEEKIERVMQATLKGPPDVEVAMRAWALQDALVRTYQERIDHRRLSYLKEVFYALTHDETQAFIMAQLIYTVYIGSQHIIPSLRREDLAQLYQEYKRLYSLS